MTRRNDASGYLHASLTARRVARLCPLCHTPVPGAGVWYIKDCGHYAPALATISSIVATEVSLFPNGAAWDNAVVVDFDVNVTRIITGKGEQISGVPGMCLTNGCRGAREALRYPQGGGGAGSARSPRRWRLHWPHAR